MQSWQGRDFRLECQAVNIHLGLIGLAKGTSKNGRKRPSYHFTLTRFACESQTTTTGICYLPISVERTIRHSATDERARSGNRVGFLKVSWLTFRLSNIIKNDSPEKKVFSFCFPLINPAKCLYYTICLPFFFPLAFAEDDAADLVYISVF